MSVCVCVCVCVCVSGRDRVDKTMRKEILQTRTVNTRFLSFFTQQLIPDQNRKAGLFYVKV